MSERKAEHFVLSQGNKMFGFGLMAQSIDSLAIVIKGWDFFFML